MVNNTCHSFQHAGVQLSGNSHFPGGARVDEVAVQVNLVRFRVTYRYTQHNDVAVFPVAQENPCIFKGKG